jgi:hypothetical protein
MTAANINLHIGSQPEDVFTRALSPASDLPVLLVDLFGELLEYTRGRNRRQSASVFAAGDSCISRRTVNEERIREPRSLGESQQQVPPSERRSRVVLFVLQPRRRPFAKTFFPNPSRFFGRKRIHNRRPSRINAFEDESGIIALVSDQNF